MISNIVYLTKKMESKPKFFINNYLNERGQSDIIVRYELPTKIHWTSGDGIFRMDAILAKKLKFCTFKRKVIRYSWDYTIEEEKHIKLEHETMDFTNTKPNSVIYIKCYGYKEVMDVCDEGIRKDIRDTIVKERCLNCYSNKNIECDHKNDLKNDPRVLKKETQTLDDFQPLCKHCNMTKKSIKQKMLQINQRIGGRQFGYIIDFISGTEYLDQQDVNWYRGTYWGDIKAFKQALTI